MKKLGLIVALLAAPAFAQTVAAPVAPTPPSVAAPAAATPSQTMSLEQFMQQSLTPEKQEKLKRAMLGAVLVQCVGQKSGAQPAQALYQQVEGVGKQVNADCKSNQAPQARALVLTTIDAHKSDPMMGYLHDCYLQHTGDIAMLDAVGQQDAAKYDHWMRDPAAAHKEMTDADVCHPPKEAPHV